MRYITITTRLSKPERRNLAQWCANYSQCGFPCCQNGEAEYREYQMIAFSQASEGERIARLAKLAVGRDFDYSIS